MTQNDPKCYCSPRSWNLTCSKTEVNLSSAWVTRLECPKGVKDDVKQARRAKRVAEGHQLEIGAQRAPRFLVKHKRRTDLLYWFHCLSFERLSSLVKRYSLYVTAKQIPCLLSPPRPAAAVFSLNPDWEQPSGNCDVLLLSTITLCSSLLNCELQRLSIDPAYWSFLLFLLTKDRLGL